MGQPVVIPKLTPPPTAGSSGLPADLVSEQGRRIVLFTGVAAFMWAFGFVMDSIVLPATVGTRAPFGPIVVE